MRIYIGCFGSGMGHASRMLEVAGVLTAKGSSVEFSSSGEVATLIRRSGYVCNLLPLADVRYSEAGEFALKQTLVNSPSMLARTYHQVVLETSNIASFSPDAVLSDSALSTVLAAKALGLPVFTVLNQLNLTNPEAHSSTPSKLLSFGTSTAMGKLWELSDLILFPDLPPPYTISEKNLWGSNTAKTRYVGFLAPSKRGIPDKAAAEFSGEKGTKIFWQVSGPPNTRSAFLRLAFQCAAALSGRCSFVITGGNPTSSSEAVRISGGWYYGWCDITDEYFRACDLVVSRAGHGTIGQAIMSSKPSLLIPIPKQPEQEGNAHKASRLGVSILLQQDDATVQRVSEALEDLSRGEYAARARKLGQWARGFDAGKEIVRILENAASGGRREPR